jgi:hypothetical protein
MTAGESWPYGCPFYGIRYEEAMMSIRSTDDDWWAETDGFPSAVDAFIWADTRLAAHIWIDKDGNIIPTPERQAEKDRVNAQYPPEDGWHVEFNNANGKWNAVRWNPPLGFSHECLKP